MAVPLTYPRTLPRTKMAGYRFDGVNGYIEVADDDSLDISSTITVAAWVLANSTISHHTILSKGDWSHGYTFWVHDNKLKLRLEDVYTGDGYGLASATTLRTGTWYYVVGVYDGSRIELYINGELDRWASATGSIGTSGANDGVYVGSDGLPSIGSRFYGGISEVVIFAEALSDEDVRKLYEGRVMPTSFDCRLWLPLYEHHTHDRSGHENHGVNHGAIYEVSG